MLPGAKNNLYAAGKWWSHENEKNCSQNKTYVRMVCKSKSIYALTFEKRNLVTIMEIK